MVNIQLFRNFWKWLKICSLNSQNFKGFWHQIFWYSVLTNSNPLEPGEHSKNLWQSVGCSWFGFEMSHNDVVGCKVVVSSHWHSTLILKSTQGWLASWDLKFACVRLHSCLTLIWSYLHTNPLSKLHSTSRSKSLGCRPSIVKHSIDTILSMLHLLLVFKLFNIIAVGKGSMSVSLTFWFFFFFDLAICRKQINVNCVDLLFDILTLSWLIQLVQPLTHWTSCSCCSVVKMGGSVVLQGCPLHFFSPLEQ